MGISWESNWCVAVLKSLLKSSTIAAADLGLEDTTARRAPRYSCFDPLDRVDDVRESHRVIQHRLVPVVNERNVNGGPAVVVGKVDQGSKVSRPHNLKPKTSYDEGGRKSPKSLACWPGVVGIAHHDTGHFTLDVGEQ